MLVNVYLAVQRLNLSDDNWNELIALMQSKGDNLSPYPNNRNHWRPSLDETIWIFEARFDEDEITVASFQQWLANKFSVPVENITHNSGINSYGRFTSFAYNSINRFRIGLFGWVDGYPSWKASNAATNQYIIDNISDWESE